MADCACPRAPTILAARQRPQLLSRRRAGPRARPGGALMLDLVIKNGQVITPQGVGPWDIGVEGERIAAVGAPGTLSAEGARVIDAAGAVVSPGGVEPHTHLAHGIMSRPD